MRICSGSYLTSVAFSCDMTYLTWVEGSCDISHSRVLVQAMAENKVVNTDKLITRFKSLNDVLGPNGAAGGDKEDSRALTKALMRVSRLAQKCLAYFDSFNVLRPGPNGVRALELSREQSGVVSDS